MADFVDFSLIYPSGEAIRRHLSGKDVPNIDMYELEELGLDEIFNLRSSRLCEHLTTDAETLKYRMETFSDMLENEQIGKMLLRLIPVLNDILELRRLTSDSADPNDYLSSITEIELYISGINILHSGLKQAKGGIKSRAFSSLYEKITELAESEYYAELNRKLEELTKRVREIKSITVGVNLDAQLRPVSAGVLSINPEKFKSGDVIEKILKMNFKGDEYTCIADLVPFSRDSSSNQRTALSNAFHSAINDVYRQSLKSWKKIVQSYVLDNTEFLLNLLPEIEFLVKGTELLRSLKGKGCPLCVPDIRPIGEFAFDAKSLYNPCVAVKIDGETVTNDISFDENARIYILTGPNRGGKSVITCAVGLAVVFMQLGMFVPSETAAISPVDALFTHFPTGADDTIDKGRLGEECARLGQIFDSVSENSLVLLDESLSSTGAYEASYIAAEVIAGFAQVGCRTLFATHLHELSAQLDEIRAKGGASIDTLVAGIEDGKRSFKIHRASPDGKSYARDIAEKYGLTYENIISKINSK